MGGSYAGNALLSYRTPIDPSLEALLIATHEPPKVRPELRTEGAGRPSFHKPGRLPRAPGFRLSAGLGFEGVPLKGSYKGSLKGSRRVLQGSRGPRGFGLRNRTLGLQGSAEGTL